MKVEIQMDRYGSTYQKNEEVTGTILVSANNQYERLELSLKGKLSVQNENQHHELRKIKQNNDLYIVLIYKKTEIEVTNKQQKLRFGFKLDQELIESYLGVYMQCVYMLKLKKVGKQKKELLCNQQIYIQKPNSNQISRQPTTFRIQQQIPSSKQLGQQLQMLVHLDSNIVDINNELSGYFVVQQYKGVICSVDIQLIRVEQFGVGQSGLFKEQTEIQLFQLASGNVQRDMQIPFFMIFPKYFSCPNFSLKQFQLDFIVNFQVMTEEGYKIQREIPIVIIRQ